MNDPGSLSGKTGSDKNLKKHRLMAGMHIGEIMQKPVSVRESELLSAAIKKMVKNGLMDLPVVDDHNRLIGELNGHEIIFLGSQILSSI
jgi:CBS domain-containing protein